MQKTLFILLIIFLGACTKDLSIDLDGHESKLVVNCFFSPQNNLEVNVSHSSSILSTDTMNYIDNALVEIFHKDVLIGEANQEEKGTYHINAALLSEEEYSIFVSVDGRQTVSSHDTIPANVPILSFDTISVDSKYLYCELSFKDIAAHDNYYLLEVRSQNPFMNGDTILSDYLGIVVTDFIVENGRSGNVRKRIYFSDKDIQNEEYFLSFILKKEELEFTQSIGANNIYINFNSISYDYYRYMKTYSLAQAQQIDVFSNIENGYGIFSGFTLSQDSLVFH